MGRLRTPQEAAVRAHSDQGERRFFENAGKVRRFLSFTELFW